MNGRIDETDARILEILEQDGRAPTARIAEQVGLSRPAVAERIARLESAGVILGVAAVVDPVARGLGITAFVSARSNDEPAGKQLKAFAAFVRRPEVEEAHKISGDDCYLFKIRTSSIDSLNEIIVELASAPLSFNTRTTIVMDTYCEKSGRIARGRFVE
jgi:Lrp/AsnC family transcriptional regulator, leucine-responsive regulatory protein